MQCSRSKWWHQVCITQDRIRITANEFISQVVARNSRSVIPKAVCTLHGIINVLVRHFVLGIDLHSSQVDLKHHGLGVAFMGLERLLANPNRSHNDTQILQIAVGSALWPLFWTYICSIDELELCRRRIGSAVYVQTNLELWIGLLKPCRFDLSQQLTSGARSRVKRFAVQQLKS
jgi:hypothetical protein